MSQQEYKCQIEQIKFDAMVAIHLHGQKIHDLQRKNRLIEFLSIAMPIIFLVSRLLVKGVKGKESLLSSFDFTAEVSAVILLVAVIFKHVYKWQDDEIKHELMSRRNSEIENEAERLLKNKSFSNEAIEQFLRRVKDVDDEDKSLLVGIKSINKRIAYRDVLKELNASCPICKADPWKFTEGNCDACGGDPTANPLP
jgi:mobilome CxxCx(11)CxxC protein